MRRPTLTGNAQAPQPTTSLPGGAVDSYLSAITEDPELNRADFYQLRGKLLETALPFYQSLLRSAPGDRKQEAEHARAYDRLGLVYYRTGATDAALSNYRQARTILERLVAGRDGSPHRESLIITHEHIGLALMDLGRLAEAEAEYRHALGRSEEFAGEASPGDFRWRTVTDRVCIGFATVLDREGKTAEAEASYRRAYESSRSLAAQAPTEETRQADFARNGEELSSFLGKTDRMPEALVIMRQAVVSRETIRANAPDDPEKQRELRTYSVLAQILHRLNRFDQADEAYRKALNQFEELASRFPSVPNYRVHAVSNGVNRGRLLTQLVRYADAEAAYRRAIEVADRLTRDFPKLPETTEMCLAAHHGIATMLQDRGRQHEAEEEYRKIIPIKRQLAADFPDTPSLESSLSESLSNLGNALVRQKKNCRGRVRLSGSHRHRPPPGRSDQASTIAQDEPGVSPDRPCEFTDCRTVAPRRGDRPLSRRNRRGRKALSGIPG